MHLSFSPRAALDLEEIGDYIARDNPFRACSFIDEVKVHCQRVLEMPSAFTSREDVVPGIRMAVHGKYLILFHVSEDTVRVERIVHGARHMSDIF